MAFVKDNSQLYRPSPHTHSEVNLQEDKSQTFLATVLTVDWERVAITLKDHRTDSTLVECTNIPSDGMMPEQGQTWLCAPLQYTGGCMQVALITPVITDLVRTKDAVSYKLLPNVQGYDRRTRGNYRKGWPGERAVSNSYGYTEKINEGWDRCSADFSRDRLDPNRRQWTQSTGRKVSYNDSGLVFEGAVQRPGAPNLPSVILPDGSLDATIYLQPGAQPTDRYVSGKPDVIAFAENTVRVQEYALDYPLPTEVFQTTLLDTVLGTTGDPWNRTTILSGGGISYDSDSFLASQTHDHPTKGNPLGPTTNEGATPARRGFIVESTTGTLVGYNLFDTSTYGYVLKPVLSPYTKQGRFGADFNSSYLPVVDSPDHTEARLASSCFTVRFPYEQNTTRVDVTKEGFTSFEIGATLPKEIIAQNMQSGEYEHPHGAGRSVEGHLVGSLKLVIGKNRDEEDAIDLQALGQTVLRLGADDTSLPDSGRTVLMQTRSQGDKPLKRSLNYWTKPKCGLGDAGLLTNKTGMENISLRLGLDGGLVGRVGARNENVKRKHLINGYSDGQGKTPSASAANSHSPGRPTYPSGDSNYQFHDLTKVGSPQITPAMAGVYTWSGAPVSKPDATGLSIDLHAVKDILLRAGANADGQSLLLDLAGGLVVALGKDALGRSITAALDGCIEITIKPNAKGKALSLEIDGDIDINHRGHLQYNGTGDIISECTTLRHITKTDHIVTAQNINHTALVRITNEAPDSVANNGLYSSTKNGMFNV